MRDKNLGFVGLLIGSSPVNWDGEGLEIVGNGFVGAVRMELDAWFRLHATGVDANAFGVVELSERAG